MEPPWTHKAPRAPCPLRSTLRPVTLDLQFNSMPEHAISATPSQVVWCARKANGSMYKYLAETSSMPLSVWTWVVIAKQIQGVQSCPILINRAWVLTSDPAVALNYFAVSEHICRLFNSHADRNRIKLANNKMRIAQGLAAMSHGAVQLVFCLM